MKVSMKAILFFAVTLGAYSAYAQKESAKNYPRQFCSNRSIDLLLGKEQPTTIWRAGNLCITVTPTLENIKVITYPQGSVNKEGNWAGFESGPRQSELTAELIKTEQRGQNRNMHFLKITNAEIEADIYLTLFTTLDGATLDSVAF